MNNSKSVFNRYADLHPSKSYQNLSHTVKLTCDMFEYIPVSFIQTEAGDDITIDLAAVIRTQPLVAPLMHEVTTKFYAFFTPLRLVFEQFEDFYTGGRDGTFNVTLPLWKPKNSDEVQVGTLWDYIGYPVKFIPSEDSLPLDFKKRIYNLTWNEWIIDPDIIDEVEIENNSKLLCTMWEKDIFTTLKRWQQRLPEEQLPAIALSGKGNVQFKGEVPYKFDSTSVWLGHEPTGQGNDTQSPVTFSTTSSGDEEVADIDSIWLDGDTSLQNDGKIFVDHRVNSYLMQWLQNNEIDFSQAGTFNVSDLRRINAIQVFLERNQRGGFRYHDFLQAHFGTAPRDETIQRPVFLGGMRMPLVISEVLQTSSSDDVSPQGNLAGAGISAGSRRICRYYSREPGYIFIAMTTRPRSAYMQGIPLDDLRRDRYDFFFPEFAHLSEKQMLTNALYVTNDPNNNKTPLGYYGRYQEMRTIPSSIKGEFRTELDYWHLARKFTAKPTLSPELVMGNPEHTKRIFAVQNRDGLIADIGLNIKAYRPIPSVPIPRLRG